MNNELKMIYNKKAYTQFSVCSHYIRCHNFLLPIFKSFFKVFSKNGLVTDLVNKKSGKSIFLY